MFTTTDLALMQATQTEHMMDKGCVLSYEKGPADEHGKREPVYTEGPLVVCGMSFDSRYDRRSEAFNGSQSPQADAKLRLPMGTAIKASDRFKVTERFGLALATPEIFDFIGLPFQGPSGLVALVKRVTNGADNG